MFQECFLKYYHAQYIAIHQHFFMASEYYDPDGVHDLRVAIKQLRAFFKLVEVLAPAFQAKKRIRPLRKLFKSAAMLRDIQVQQEFARARATEYECELSVYYNALKQKERPAREHFAAFSGHFDIRKVFRKNAKKIAHALRSIADADAAATIRERVTHLLKEIVAFGRANRSQEDHLHQIRILSKEARYTIEVARQCFPELGYGDELDNQLKTLHQVLGQWHDTVIAIQHVEAFLSEYRGSEEGNADAAGQADAVKVYATLITHLQQEKADLLATFDQRWDEFAEFLNQQSTVR